MAHSDSLKTFGTIFVLDISESTCNTTYKTSLFLSTLDPGCRSLLKWMRICRPDIQLCYTIELTLFQKEVTFELNTTIWTEECDEKSSEDQNTEKEKFHLINIIHDIPTFCSHFVQVLSMRVTRTKLTEGASFETS